MGKLSKQEIKTRELFEFNYKYKDLPRDKYISTLILDCKKSNLERLAYQAFCSKTLPLVFDTLIDIKSLLRDIVVNQESMKLELESRLELVEESISNYLDKHSAQ